MAWDSLLNGMAQTVRDTFGQTVAYTRRGGKTYQIIAVFDVVYSQSDAGGNVPATIAAKELDIKISDIDGAPKAQDTVLIDGISYIVKDVKTSTSGMMKAVLREAG